MPHNWNARDTTLNRSSVGWYRKEFKLPKVPKDELKRTFWKVRFEGSNYRTKVWLNGKTIGGYTGYFPFEARPRRSAQGAQHAGGEGVVGAQQPRPHALAPGRLQRLRHRRLVELRRPAARGLRAQDRHDRHRGRARPAAPAQGGRPRQGRGARLSAQHDRQGAGRRPGDRRGRAPHSPAGQAHPGELPAAAHPDVHDQAPAAVGARRPRAVPAVGDGRGGRARARRVPAALRRAQAPDRARRGDPAQRPPPQRPRREHPRGRPRTRAARSRSAPAPCSSRACATSARRSRARTTRCTRPSSRPSTGTGSSTGSTRPSTRSRTPTSTSRARAPRPSAPSR